MDTVTTTLNAVITLLLAKFIMNDLPHAADLFESSPTAKERYIVGINRRLVGADIIPGYYTPLQIPAKVQELIATAPSDFEDIKIFLPENEDMLLPWEDPSLFERPGPLLPSVPSLRDKAKLWVVSLRSDLGGEELGTARAFLIPKFVAGHLREIGSHEVMHIHQYGTLLEEME